jgi:hypothetical protein
LARGLPDIAHHTSGDTFLRDFKTDGGDSGGATGQFSITIKNAVRDQFKR